jgi:hypothetical protein
MLEEVVNKQSIVLTDEAKALEEFGKEIREKLQNCLAEIKNPEFEKQASATILGLTDEMARIGHEMDRAGGHLYELVKSL